MSAVKKVINLGHLLSGCIDAAQRSSYLIEEVLKSGELGVELKGVNDPVTNADINVQKLIVSGLINTFGNINIVGEEGEMDVQPEFSDIVLNKDLIDDNLILDKYKNVEQERVCVFIDPLDGTKEFVDGIYDAVVTLIGISLDEKCVGGVMYQPFPPGVDVLNAEEINGRTFYGLGDSLSSGIDLETTRNKINARKEKNEINIVTTRSHGSQTIEAGLVQLKNHFSDHTVTITRIGGAGNKVIKLLDGDADIYYFPEPYTKLWDTAAPGGVIEAYGGSLLSCKGNEIVYPSKPSDPKNKEGVLACFDFDIQSVLSCINNNNDNNNDN
eukprot:TRINITY_DN1585_c0_g1_i1.p1 TRINITY_DN1585_c0_g1~~TRINITY_DN1585_c0_g1_i1.p1  ORF type:complete len:327 (-),score=133.86 TRINITY_DN1585_c0_g1_i1:96-1076(-)